MWSQWREPSEFSCDLLRGTNWFDLALDEFPRSVLHLHRERDDCRLQNLLKLLVVVVVVAVAVVVVRTS